MTTLKRFFKSIMTTLGLSSPDDLSMKPISPDDLKKKLRKGKVSFFFTKINGELRMAQGTTNLKYVPSHLRPLGVKQPTPKVVNFYDMVKKQWRCVSVEKDIFIA